jgi:hypothetical protein
MQISRIKNYPQKRKELIKNKMKISEKIKKRIRDYGEVLTPDFIVNDMLDLVKNETERIDSRFLEPACGDGNFLIEILRRKLVIVERTYKKNQFDYEKYSLIAVSSIYGIELLKDNRKIAIKRLYEFFLNKYRELYKKKINQEFLKNIYFLLKQNIVHGDALTLKDENNNHIIFSEWSLINGYKIKRRDFKFIDLAEFNENKINMDHLFSDKLKSDTGKSVFIPKSVKDYPVINFMELYKLYE